MMAMHIDNRFGQVFNEVTELMDDELKKRYVLLIWWKLLTRCLVHCLQI